MHVISLCLLFSPEFLRECIAQVDVAGLPLKDGESVQDMCDKLFPVIFDPKVMPKRVNQADGEDLVITSAANYYEGVTQDEAEKFYMIQKLASGPHPVMYGMNSRLVQKGRSHTRRSLEGGWHVWRSD